MVTVPCLCEPQSKALAGFNVGLDGVTALLKPVGDQILIARAAEGSLHSSREPTGVPFGSTLTGGSDVLVGVYMLRTPLIIDIIFAYIKFKHELI